MDVSIEDLPLPILAVNTKGLIIAVNAALCQLSGYEREELLGQSVNKLVPDEVRSRHVDLMESFMAKPETRNMGSGKTLSLRSKSGAGVNVEIGLRPKTDREGQPIVMASIFDVSKLKQAEQRLIEANANLEEKVADRTKELTRSNQDLDQFAYVASHDLQEPLRTISSFTKLLEEKYADEFDDEGREFLNYIADGAKRMKNLIEDLLAYSRLNRKEEVVDVNLNDVVSVIKMNLSDTISREGIRLEVEDLPNVEASRFRMQQLFQNLLSNALKFRDLKRNEHKVDLRCSDQGAFWEFRITDNGIGMEEQNLDRIFKIFQRLHSDDEYAGTGLGLAICKRVVDELGGDISATSQLGEGSCFRFTLPK